MTNRPQRCPAQFRDIAQTSPPLRLRLAYDVGESQIQGVRFRMNVQTHWERIYAEKSPDTVSWYRPHLETSLELIERAAPARSAAIIDVGGGESTLVDDLLARGYQNVTVLDISQTAIDVTKRRLGAASEGVKWLVADIGKAELAPRAYDVWHDRAVFHLLTAVGERTAYVRQVARGVKP